MNVCMCVCVCVCMHLCVCMCLIAGKLAPGPTRKGKSYTPHENDVS